MSDKHLPAFMRDFHDQKRLFKTLERTMGRPEDGVSHGGRTSWVSGMIFTIDRFLPFMAKHGYTLRHTRTDCADIEDTMKQFDEFEINALKNMLADMSKNQKG